MMQEEREFNVAGVSTPLDFCFLMLTTNFTDHLNILNGVRDPAVLLFDADVFSKQLVCFKHMFGRNPMKADSANWMTITIYEMYFRNKRIDENLTFDDLLSMVTPKVRDFPTRCIPEWTDEIKEQFQPCCEKLAQNLKRRKM